MTRPETTPALAARWWCSLQRALSINPEDFPYMRLNWALAAWRWIGANLTILSWINEGFRLPLLRDPPPFNAGNSTFVGEDLCQWRLTLTKYLRLGALCPARHLSHVSRAFMVPKPDGIKRLNIDLRTLNLHIANRHLRMAGLRDLAYSIKPGDSIILWNIADAYFHIAVHPRHVKFCTICINGTLWEIPILPFGLKTSPYIFSKVATVLVRYL